MKTSCKAIISVLFSALIFGLGCGVLPADVEEEECPEELDWQSCEALPNCYPLTLGGVDPDACEASGARLTFCIHYDKNAGNDTPGFWTRWEDGEWKFYRSSSSYGYMRTKKDFVDCRHPVETWPQGERPEACELCHPGIVQ